jgi:hypothetical protein
VPTLLRLYCRLAGLSPEALQDRRTYMRLYMRLRRLLRSLELGGALELYRADGMLWARPRPALVDLMCANAAKLKRGRGGGARYAHPCRHDASLLLSRRRSLGLGDWLALWRLLLDYVEDAAQRVIVLKEAGGSGFAFRRYRHRFTKGALRRAWA